MDSLPLARAFVNLKHSKRLLCPRLRSYRLLTHRRYDGYLERLPTRAAHIKELRHREYDVLVIGGGITGAGCALDATSRGLITALVDADDFASGNSSKSTKLIHGGLQYGFNFGQLSDVCEALRERAIMQRIAPYMCRPLPIMIPIYSLWDVAYVWLARKVYDLLSLGNRLGASHYVSRDKVLAEFPLLDAEGLRGAVVYYDAQFDDARFSIALILTASYCGANVANYMNVVAIQKQAAADCFRRVCVHDRLTDEHFVIHTRSVINATGAYTEQLRQMVELGVANNTQHSCATHITLPACYCSREYGLLNPKTDNGHVVLMCPWQGHTLAGRTVCDCQRAKAPVATPAEVDYILNNVRCLMVSDLAVSKTQVRAAWSGLRTRLANNRKNLPPAHLIEVNDGNVITVVGGDWPTYRRTAETAVDAAISCAALQPLWSCYTDRLPIVGSIDYAPDNACDIKRIFNLNIDVAQHLARTYGANSYALLGQMPPDMRERIHPDLPYIDAEVFYACSQEYACTVIDVIARRMRIACLDARIAYDMLPKIVCIMSNVLQWTSGERAEQMRQAKLYLRQQMSLADVVKPENCMEYRSHRTEMSGKQCL